MIIWYDQIYAIIVARLLAGAAHGVLYVAVLAHSAENAEQNNRGTLLASLSVTLTLGVFFFAVLHYAVATTQAITIDRLIGIFGMVFSALAIIMASLLTYESVPYLLRAGNETKALQNMMRLRSESMETQKIHQDFQEMKLMVSQDMRESRNPFSEGNCRPTMFMTAIKVMAFCGNNWVLNIIQIYIVALVVPGSNQLAPLILTAVRLIMSVVTAFVVDLMPRKLMLAISGGATGVVLLVTGILEVSVTGGGGVYALLVFCILHQLTVAFGVDPLQHILMAEAFSTTKKTWSITCIAILEHLMHIIALAIFMNVGLTIGVMIAIPFISAVVIAVITTVLYFTMPETVGMTLRAARDEFNTEKHHAVVYSRENNGFHVA